MMTQRPGGGSEPGSLAVSAGYPPGIGRWRGQALVEFAIVLTVLMFLVVGGIDFGRAFYFDIAASSAAMAGASSAANGAQDVDVRSAAGKSVGSIMPTPGVTITPSEGLRDTSTCTPSTCIWTTVTATYQFQPITPLLGSMIGSNINITRTVSQRMRSPCQTSAGAAC